MTLEERQAAMRERMKFVQRNAHKLGAVEKLVSLLDGAAKIRKAPQRFVTVREDDSTGAAFHAILRLADEPLEEYFPMSTVELLARLYKIGRVAEAALNRRNG